MVNAIIHLANKDYASLVDDFVDLEVLPADCDRVKVIPLMDKALSPYVKGGGAQRYAEEVQRMYGMEGDGAGAGPSAGAAASGFAAMTSDALTVLNDIPFSIPPYFAILGRALVTLEGVALTGDPNYGLIMEAYPFVSRKLLSDGRPSVQKALSDVLYAEGSLKPARLSVLLNSAMGVVARQPGSSFIDLDTVPDDAVDLSQAVSYLLGDGAGSLRPLLVDEAEAALDVLLRQAARKGFTQVTTAVFGVPLLGGLLARGAALSVPGLLRPPQEILDAAAPKLSVQEELYAISLGDAVLTSLGADAAVVARGDSLLEPQAALRLVLAVAGNSAATPAAVRRAAGAVVAESDAVDEVAVREVWAGLSPEEKGVAQGVASDLVSRLWAKMAGRVKADLGVALPALPVDALLGAFGAGAGAGAAVPVPVPVPVAAPAGTVAV